MADDGINDQVKLTLGGTEVLIATGYDITQSVLEQPANFSLRLGQGKSIAGLIQSIPPNTPFTLDVAGHRRMTGRTDGVRATSSGTAPTELTIFGRDVLAPLHDAHIAEEQSFNNDTYKSFVQKILTIVGLNPNDLVTLDGDVLENKKLQAGVPITQLLPIHTIKEFFDNYGNTPGVTAATTAGATAQSLQAKVGERWIDFVRKQLDRAGLFLWGGGSGNIILSKPSSDCDPIYRIMRTRGQDRDEVNVISFDYLNDTRPRYTFCGVYGRMHSPKKGVNKSIGNSSDDIMINAPPAGYGYGFNYKGEPINTRALVVHDVHCKNNAQAAYLAQRKLAEGRRHGFQLVYTLAGHSTKSIAPGAGRVVWTPDTTVEVWDDELGIKGEIFWIDSVDFRRGPQTTTTIRLMHKYDVIFGTPDFEGTNGVGTGFPKTPDVGDSISVLPGIQAFIANPFKIKP